MLIIDTESHIFWFARNHYTSGLSMIRHFTWHEHSADLFVAEMDNAGVSKAFLISYDAEDTKWGAMQKGFELEDFAGGKKYTKLGWKKYPDRFYWFSTIKDPKNYPTSEIVKEDLDEGAKGIKIFPAFIHQPLNEPEIMKVFQLCDEKNAAVLISFEVLRPPHTLNLTEYLGQLEEVLDTFPQVNFCLLHNGCADPLTKAIEPICRLAKLKSNLYLSTAFPGEVWDDGTEYPFPNYLRRIKVLADNIGTERLMWATDWPWFEWAFKYEQGVNAILRHADFLNESQKEDFMGKAAIKFLKE
jgi:predicted TIM-barrel fold metal-dependent hydrolase